MQQATRTLDPLRVLSDDERREHLAAYRRFLETRDGEADLAARPRWRPQPPMRAIAGSPVVWRGAVDEAGFRSCLDGERRVPLDPRTGWVLAAAKGSEAEG